jgi:hypothetical protein
MIPTLRSALCALVLAAPVAAQITAPPAPPPDPEPGEALVVYLMTMGEGDLVYERFGHNAIWVHDPVNGTDHTYNWGLFDFDEEGFLREFIRGRMWYWMDAFDARATTRGYVARNRSVWVQELELTPRQRVELVEFMEWNRLPDNRFYRYDYYHDNCSTRVRDALDRALGGQIREQTAGVPSGTTFRSHTRRVTAIAPVTYTGLMVGLGRGVDREISLWEEMFLPLSLRETVRELTVADAAGRQVPLVRSEQTLFLADRPPLPEAPPRWWPVYLAVGLTLALLLLVLGHLAGRNAVARSGAAGLGALWGVLAGGLGVVLAGLWAFTDHAAAYHNENLFQFNPLALPLVVLFPLLVYRPLRWGGVTAAVAVAVAGLSLVGALLKALPSFFQGNGDLIALALPVHLALAGIAVLWFFARRIGSGAAE